MAQNRATQLPMPINGLNTLTPFIDIEAGYARELTNLVIANGRLHPRPAHTIETTGALGSHLQWFDKSAGTWYGVCSNGDIVNVATAAVLGTVGGALGIYPPTRVKHSTLDYVIGLREPRLAAYPFTAWTFTTVAIVATQISSACSHKGRLYVANYLTGLEYSPLAAVTGAMVALVDLAAWLDGQYIQRIFSVNISPNITQQNVLVIFGTGGKVLVFEGDDPGAANWALIGSFNMPPPIGKAGFVEIDGDIFVATTEYCYWFRDLFTQGAQSAYDSSPSRPIENLYQAVYYDGISTTNPEYAHCYYIDKVGDLNVDAIVVQCSEKNTGAAALSTIANYGNEAACFVYFRKYKAWALWLAPPFFAPIREVSDVFYGLSYQNGQITKLISTTMVDIYGALSTEIDIETSWKTSYLSPFAGKAQRVNGVRPFFSNSKSGHFEKIAVIADLSDYNAPWGFYTQSNVTNVPPGISNAEGLDLPANTWGQYNAIAAPQVIGGAVSVQLTQKKTAGSIGTYSQSLYAAVAYIEDGGDLF